MNKRMLPAACGFALLAACSLSLPLPLPAAQPASAPDHRTFAPTPPMGWNSWDIFGTTLTEKQAREQANAMARHLKPAGYDIFTVDIQWYEPDSRGHVYKAGAPLEMDEYSRLLPALKKFPSAANGVGFKALADEVHAKGLRFGIHIMRGIPRQAVRDNTPLRGTTARARDIANTNSICSWNPDMYGVDMSKPGAQEYYDSLIELYASWGVDFIKCDDIARPYNRGQMAEIEALRKAIDKCGRPIVLSLSPGDTPIGRGDHVMRHANLWRISDDFWDRWEPLKEMFGRLERWTPYRGNGAWPDADMLPFGIVEFGRPTRFSKDEQILCMTLWCIARSPLIFGGDMTRLDEFTLNLLTNPEVIAVNQKSENNRQILRKEDLVAWAADVPGSPDRYVALFNAGDNDSPFNFSEAVSRTAVLRGKGGQEAGISVPVTGAKRLVLVVDNGGDNHFYDHAAWIEPTLSGTNGTLRLTDLQWTSATAGWGEVRLNRSAAGAPLTRNGQPSWGIGTHAASAIAYELPAGYDRFTARGMITAVEGGTASIRFLVLVDPNEKRVPEMSRVSVSLADLGIQGRARVRDLWKREDAGEISESLTADLPLRGSRLFRLSPVK